MASLFKTDIKNLKGVGQKSADCLNKLGVSTIGDLIYLFPRTYEDWTHTVKLNEALEKKEQCLRLKIISPCRTSYSKSGKVIYRILASDGINNVNIIFFNNKFLAKSLNQGCEYLFRGNVGLNFGAYELVSPKVKNIDDAGAIYPVYPQTKGITSAKISKFVSTALEMLPCDIAETLPEYILKEQNLASLNFALRSIHFPQNNYELDLAHNRLVFEEFFIYRLSMALIKNQSRKKSTFVISKDFTKEFETFLPFELTEAQKNAIRECNIDMINSGLVMNRLLQGDVGSGKTAVAAAVIYTVVKNGYQAAVMAPTEILATQHYETFCKMFKNTNLKIRLLCGSLRKKSKDFIHKEIEYGDADIVIGTQALLSEGVYFKKLGIIVTDEQHRFGVNQRATLISKGANPHVLVMSATPIPRTLALVVYGDLDISTLNQALPGRKKIDTFRITDDKRARAINFLRKIVDEGGQGYIVCAGIEENDNDIIDVETYSEKNLKNVFALDGIGVLHGKMPAYEKDEIMQKFVTGDIKVLVSTTVIEVGVDVPNARIIIIENAERFGISQLHQLRGRVGRNSMQCYCVLISNSKSQDSTRRFNAMVNSNDGFSLSEEDLKIRGPGDFFGVNQHGVPRIGISTLYKDVELMKSAQDVALEIVSKDPELLLPEHKYIKGKIKKLLFDQQNDGNGNIIF